MTHKKHTPTPTKKKWSDWLAKDKWKEPFTRWLAKEKMITNLDQLVSREDFELYYKFFLKSNTITWDDLCKSLGVDLEAYQAFQEFLELQGIVQSGISSVSSGEMVSHLNNFNKSY